MKTLTKPLVVLKMANNHMNFLDRSIQTSVNSGLSAAANRSLASLRSCSVAIYTSSATRL
jgi:hypothetical protein